MKRTPSKIVANIDDDDQVSSKKKSFRKLTRDPLRPFDSGMNYGTPRDRELFGFMDNRSPTLGIMDQNP